MWYWYVIGAILGVFIVVILDSKKMKNKILDSTKDIWGILIFGVIVYWNLIVGNYEWWIIPLLGMILLYIYGFFNNKKRERAILNTIQYMINIEKLKILDTDTISNNLEYNSYFVLRTLRIYKKKALVPYNVEILQPNN